MKKIIIETGVLHLSKQNGKLFKIDLRQNVVLTSGDGDRPLTIMVTSLLDQLD